MKRVGVLLAALAIAGCGGGSSSAGSATSWQQDAGCSSVTEQETEEIYVRELFDCPTAAGATNVYTFNNTQARDAWIDAAELFGVVVIKQGDTWVQVEP